MWGGTFEELDAAVDAFIRFPKLRTKSEYTLEIGIIRRSSCDPISVRSHFCTFLLTFSTSALHENYCFTDEGRGELGRTCNKAGKDYRRACVRDRKRWRVLALDEREGQMKHVGKVDTCDRRKERYADRSGKMRSKEVRRGPQEREGGDTMSNVQCPKNS